MPDSIPWLFTGHIHVFDPRDRLRYKAAFRLFGSRFTQRFSRRTFRTATSAREYGERVEERLERARFWARV